MNKQAGLCFLGIWGFCVLALCACGFSPPLDGIAFTGGEEFAPEREFLEQTLGRGEFLEENGLYLVSPEQTAEQVGKKKNAAPSVLIEFEVSWTDDGGIPLSKTWYVPKANPLEGRGGTTFAACQRGDEDLLPLAELSPPWVALPVDNRAADDVNYPLIRRVSIRLRAAGEGEATGGKQQQQVSEKIAALEAKLAALYKPLIEAAPAIVWIASAGDLMLGRGSGDILLREGAEGIFGKTAGYLENADLCLLNLEGSVSSRGSKIEKTFNFRFNPQYVPALKKAGIDAVLLANNHVFDFGEAAFLDTLQHLAANNIAVLGAGRNIAEAARPFIYQKGSTTVRVFGIASFPRERSGWDGSQAAAGLDRPGLLFAGKGGTEQLKAALGENSNALNVLLFHGGNEWTWEPDAATRRLYTELAHSGADLLIGSHPHTVQGFEWLEGKMTFWSLGNYVFAGMDGTDGGEEGLLVRLGYAGKTLVYVEVVPVQLKGPRSAIGPPEQLRRFYSLSKKLAAH